MDFPKIDYSFICELCSDREFKNGRMTCTRKIESPDSAFNCKYSVIPIAMDYYSRKIKFILKALNKVKNEEDLEYIISHLQD